jgi:hypothetical protein
MEWRDCSTDSGPRTILDKMRDASTPIRPREIAEKLATRAGRPPDKRETGGPPLAKVRNAMPQLSDKLHGDPRARCGFHPNRRTEQDAGGRKGPSRRSNGNLSALVGQYY